MKSFSLRRWAALLLCSIVIIALQLPLPVRAADKYIECPSASISVLLDETGGATVTESWECYFGGDTISRYRRRYKNPDPDVCAMEVLDVSIDGEPMELLDAPDDSRPEGCAAVYQEDGKTMVEMYLRAYEESHSLEITYYISSMVILYNDIAEFHWDLTGDKESFDIDFLTAWIEIPHGTADRGLAFWANGVPEGSTFEAQYDADNLPYAFFLSTASIPKDQAVTVRFAMPLELFPAGSRIIEEDALDTLREQQHALMKPDTPEPEHPDNPVGPIEPEQPTEPEPGLFGKFTDFLEDADHLRADVMQIWSILAAALCMAPMVVYMLLSTPIEHFFRRYLLPRHLARERLKPWQAPDYYRTLPDQLTPAMVYQLMTVYPVKGEGKAIRKKGNPFSATILDLVERGVLHARRNEAGKEVYRVSPAAAEAELTPYEQAILELFTTAGADAADMTTEQITAYMREHYSWCKQQYQQFHTCVEEAFEAAGLTRLQHREGWSKKTVWIICICFGLFVAVGISYLLFPLAGLIVGAATGFVGGLFISAIHDSFHPDYYLLTQEGENRYALWKAYNRFLKDFTTLKERNLDDLTVWRKHLVYAAALGCSDQVIESLRVSMPETYGSFVSDPYLCSYNELYSSVCDIDDEGGYTIHSSSSSDSDWGDDGGSSDSDWGGCSDSGGGSDSGSDGSDFD